MTMTPEQIEEMKRDREAGTPGPWAASPMHIEEADPAVRTSEGWIIANVPWDREARRIARVPDMEAHILALTAEIDRLRAKVEAGQELMLRGNELCFAAQTTGGTAGPDAGLRDAIDDYARALTAYREAGHE